jgi:hypothetical protein
MTATETVLEERIAQLEETVASLLRMNAYIISVLTPPVVPTTTPGDPVIDYSRLSNGLGYKAPPEPVYYPRCLAQMGRMQCFGQDHHDGQHWSHEPDGDIFTWA